MEMPLRMHRVCLIYLLGHIPNCVVIRVSSGEAPNNDTIRDPRPNPKAILFQLRLKPLPKYHNLFREDRILLPIILDIPSDSGHIRPLLPELPWRTILGAQTLGHTTHSTAAY